MPTKMREVQRPRGLLRLGFRLPIWLFRFHLGWLLGERFLLLTHKGRKSGLPHQTVLEVLQHTRADDIYYVFSGWGAHADWVRNVEQAQDVRLIVGTRSTQAHAWRISAEEAVPIILDYVRRHPIAIRVLPRLMGYQVDGTEADFRAFVHLGVVVAFHSTPSSS